MSQKPGFGKRMMGFGVDNWFIQTSSRIAGTLIGIGVVCIMLGGMFFAIIYLASPLLAIAIPTVGILLIIGGILFMVKMNKIRKRIRSKVV